MTQLNRRGFTFIELLVALLVTSVVMGAAAAEFQSYESRNISQDQTVSLEQNLRAAMNVVTDAMRTSGFGLPNGAVPDWVGTATGITTNPQISGTSPAALSLVGCFQQPAATLSANAASGATTLSVSGSVANNAVILLDDNDLAKVTGVSSGTISIDTDPNTAGAQGVTRAYPAGTPICVFDALTFSIQTDTGTGTSWLQLAGGSNPGTVADGITNLQITTLTAGQQYGITLTASSQSADPLTGVPTVRSLQSTVTLRD
jgi:prepilin-type N-terminal cleavage/methylation domain-containing protein